jgi:hypothetical protein
MITKRRSSLRTLAGVAIAAMVLLPAAQPARAASTVEIEARAMLAGRYEIGGWLAVSVTLVNDGTPTEGWLSASTDAGSVRRFVELPAGSRKAVTLYVQPGGFQRELEIQYDEPNGTVSTQVDVDVLAQAGDHVAIVGDGTGALRPQLAGVGIEDAPEPILLTAADLPERLEPMAGLSTLVWAADGGTLSEGQRRSIERWIGEGGQLIVLGGADWQARTAAFVDLLPMEGLGAVDGVSQVALAAWAGVDAPPIDEASVVTGSLREDARALATAEDGTPLVTMRSIGAGRVILLGTDLAVEEFRGWDGSPPLWSRLMPTGALFEAAFGVGMPDRDQTAGSMAQALNTLPALEVPPAELLLAVIVGYILLIGPISYLVLRRLDRRELAWITAPVLVVVFSACSYGIGVSLKGSDVIVNQIAVVRSSTAGSTASVETYAGVFSPSDTSLDVLVEADALMGRMRSAGFEPGTTAPASRVASEQGDPARLRGLTVSAGGFEYLRADAIVEHEPVLSVTWAYEDGDIVGTVTNVGEVPLIDVAYISTFGGERIGALEPGASATFTASEDNPNSTSASDQVYGFGGLDASDPERRRIIARRGVIDALVGVGGWFTGGSELGGMGGRGPFIIGWHAGEGPMPITLEGTDPQRYSEVVEVVSIQPGLGRGDVVISPGQMGITIAAEGDVIQVAGTVSIVDGTATFGISLPLSAMSMTVEDVEIVVGPDPISVVQDPGQFGGFWPQGYLVELRDPRSGEWSELGDLEARNRFKIEEPAAAVSSTGRIDVRVTVAEADPTFGQPPVFISARVSGVIDE